VTVFSRGVKRGAVSTDPGYNFSLKEINLELGFETIGNATLIVHDKVPVLVTDPWIEGSAYFGSWRTSHEIPSEQREKILAAPMVWFSHGHPDHLNAQSVPLFKDREILLPDHVGGRIKEELTREGYRVRVLPDWTWVKISERVKILCIADVGQDAVLLVDVGGRLVIDSNDTGDNGWGSFVRRIVKKYPLSFLLRLSGYGDADMMNFYDESGKFITPAAAERLPIGRGIQETTERFGAKFFIPFSSMHRYQRADSVWANKYVAGLDEYRTGFASKRCELLPAFIQYDCLRDTYEMIRPKEISDLTMPEADFGDNWSDELEKDEVVLARRYFQAIESLRDRIGQINLKVGGKTHSIPLNPKHSDYVVTFEVPRQSLVTATRYEIFDDLLIGNFMKTTLNGPWAIPNTLHPFFSGYVGKYADNGRAKTKAEVRAYVREYERRCWGLRMKNWETRLKFLAEGWMPRGSVGFNVSKAVYRSLRRTFRYQ
jgi:hypothetical protein